MNAARGARFAAAVTGVGLVTAAGIGAERTWHHITHSTTPSGVGPHPALAGMPCDFAYTVGGFDSAALLGVATSRLMDRFSQLAVVAAREAVSAAGLDHRVWDGDRVAVVIGSGHGGVPFYDEQIAVLGERGARRVSPKVGLLTPVSGATDSVCRDLGAGGPSFAISTACASGTHALGTAHQLLRSGACDIVIAGGAESAASRLLVAGANQLKALSTRRDDPTAACRPFDADRDGFVLGEGAGLLVLERPEHARARGATVLAELTGYGAATDPDATVAPDPDGAGLERALRAALADAGLTGSDVDHVNAHGTGTVLNDLVESAVIARVCGPRPLVTSTKAMTGHTLGASGGIESALTVLALRHQLVPPTANLTSLDPAVQVEVVAKEARPARLDCAVKSSMGFGGFTAALVLTRA
ncbi:beta-ketoacyl-[acyl-carrier-protein] synthase family protein [Streptomyces sp. NBC_01433]|uniref:beta-ketoacyl-[acyl-carrier-protein] synthase family protein n=1 Tax=Streptomyces sp. NBC_01433 TaxID=2903864 RepID=UPI002255EDBE|nr:beta-ketoacyl-[acyl-carrier-protein] synthase family protein [Streptomyces sp. NBC_01433]MCX4681757.1 beta-ketoacyl-[acyl-carrier-protein] synthase family protein [Streptomyces sp. NBC_01433]